MVCSRLLSRILAFVLSLSATVSALPPDFTQEQFVGGLADPATMTFAPDGRLFVGERIAGEIRIVTPGGQLLSEPFLTLDVPPERHRSGGLRGFAFDPAYPAEPYIYVFYTKQFANEKRHNRLSRFTTSPNNPDSADASSETVLLELPFNSTTRGSSGSHNGGAVVFGGDGKLYVTTGDGWLDDSSNNYFAGDDVQSLTTYTGKVFRINRDGTIPTDNPFYSQTTGDFRAIYALGLRNPYSATAHPVTGEIFVFDVGTANGGNKDYIYRIAPGDNYGHDGFDGIGTRTGTWARLGTQIVSGGTWYFSDQFPSTYHGRLFVTAWKRGLKTVTSESDPTVIDFASADTPNQGPLQATVGPDGSLYYLDSTYETSDGKIFKISYTAANTVTRPTASPAGGDYDVSVDVSLTATTPGSTIRFSTDGTIPDATSLEYTSPLTFTETTTLTARAFINGMDPSPPLTATYIINPAASPAFASSPTTSANVASSYFYDANATGVPPPTFSLDDAPPGMTIDATTGALNWSPESVGEPTVSIRATNGTAPDAIQTFVLTVNNFRLADFPDQTALTSGVHFAYFEGTSPAVSGSLSRPDLSPRQREDGFSFRFTGFLEIPTDGEYTFASEGSLQIGNASVGSGAIGLQAGKHAFTLTYEDIPGADTLTLSWNGQEIPASAYFRFSEPFGQFAREPSPAYLNFPSDGSGSIPATLSSTGAFSDIATLTAVPGLVPYTMNSPLWSDGASKLRWISVPTGTAITFDPEGDWVFPPGTVLIKHFALGDERRRIETRFEVIRESGIPILVTYRWRTDGSEADLVPQEGASENISFDGDQSQTWFFPSQGDCVACHNSTVDYVLGPRTRQMNGTFTYPQTGVTDNQLRTWSHLGLFSNPPAETSTLDSLTTINSDAALAHRVRSYLDANCSFCHNPTASPEGTDFVLDFNTPLEATGLIGGAAIPQDPANSALFHRLATNSPELRMPPIGRDIIDGPARDAILDWLLSLPSANTSEDIPGATRRWTFDNIIDSGAWRDTSQPTFATGQMGDALVFDGIDDAVDLGPIDVSGTGLTIALWFRADNFDTSDARFLSKADGQLDQDHYWMLSALNRDQLRIRLRAGGNTTTLISPDETLSTNTWTHVAATYDGSFMRLYKNGVEVASTAKTGVLDTNGTVDAAIGNQPTTASGGARPFDGLIDDLRIYDRALSAAELAVVRDAGDQTNAAPEIILDTPANYLTRAEVSGLTGSASDAEDGAIAPTWFSNIDGTFTPGTSSLSDGAHRIVLTGRDGSGSATSQSTSITVVPGFAGWIADGNGTRLEDYAFATSPVIDLASDETFTIEFPTRTDAIDLTYTLQFSDDLSDWIEGATFTPQGDSVLRVPGVVGENVAEVTAAAPRRLLSAPIKRRMSAGLSA